MPQFFIKSSDITDDTCIIDGEDFHHIVNVRRCRVNDGLTVRLDDGSNARTRIIEIGEHHLTVKILGRDRFTGSVDITLCLALLKGKKFELAIQKAAEVGVNRIIPVSTERTVPVVSGGRKDRIERWRKIAIEASKQSLKSRITEIGDITGFDALIISAANGTRIIAHPGGTGPKLKEIIDGSGRAEQFTVLVGPEGGFSDRELAFAKENGWPDINFGRTHMRAETAAIVIPAIIIYAVENR